MSAAAPEKRSTLGTARTIVAASSGNLVEWFDFYIYAFFSVYFADKFFTGTGETGALLRSAAVFFAGFLMRPIGGYLFGRIADRHGRKRSMLIAILLIPVLMRRHPSAAERPSSAAGAAERL